MLIGVIFAGLGIFTPAYWHETPAIHFGRGDNLIKILINTELCKLLGSVGCLTEKKVHPLEAQSLFCQIQHEC